MILGFSNSDLKTLIKGHCLVPYRTVGRIAIAVAGGSCSGKTTLSHALADHLSAQVIKVDDYYRPLNHLTYEQRCEVNFDHPEAIDHVLMVQHVSQLLRGEAIDAPRYDFTCHNRFAETIPIAPTEVLIIEGLFVLAYPELADLCEVRVFVDAPEAICLQRRLLRDTLERGRSPEEVNGRFNGHVWPMYLQHVLPTKEAANVHVSGEETIRSSMQKVLKKLPVPVLS